MQRSNVFSFLAGVVLTAAVFYGSGIGSVSDGGQGFIFKRPPGGSGGDQPIVIQNQRNFDGQQAPRVEPTPNPVIPRAEIEVNEVRPEEPAEPVAPQVNRSNLVNQLAVQLTTLDNLQRNYFAKRSWLLTDFCDISGADAKRTRVLNSLNTIDTNLRTARRLMTVEELESSQNLNTLRTAISSISLSLMNLEEVVDGVPTRCLSPFWKYAAFPEVSESVIDDLTSAGEWNEEWAERIVDLAYTERTRSVPAQTIGQSINNAFAALDQEF